MHGVIGSSNYPSDCNTQTSAGGTHAAYLCVIKKNSHARQTCLEANNEGRNYSISAQGHRVHHSSKYSCNAHSQIPMILTLEITSEDGWY